MARENADSGNVDILERENSRLKRAIGELTILNDLSRAIGASKNSEEIMRTIVRRSLDAVHAEQGVITLSEEKADQPMKTLLRTAVTSSEHRPFRLSQSILGWMQLKKMPLLLNSPREDDRFRGVEWDESVRSLLAVPLIIQSRVRGVLTIFNKRGGKEFTSDDQRLLAIIAGQSAQVIETARLYEEERTLEALQEEVKVASEIQKKLLPKEAPCIKGYDVAGISVPAREVGGDYFDFICMDENRWAICLGDVSGKGLPAALLVSNLQATIRGQALLKPRPKECVGRTNRLLYASTEPHKFATFFFGILNTEEHIFCYSNAGHDPPFFFHDDGELSRMKTGGLLLSFMEEFEYKETERKIGPGDLFVAYSDGITEAVNESEEEFGEDRLSELIRKHRLDPAQKIMECIIRAAIDFAGDRPARDDMTLVVFKRNQP